MSSSVECSETLCVGWDLAMLREVRAVLDLSFAQCGLINLIRRLTILHSLSSWRLKDRKLH
jgi:hypothetical protein